MHKWLPWAFLKLLQNMLGQKLLKVVKNKKQIYCQKLPKKRRIKFRREALLSQKLNADLIFALNKVLQKTRIPTYILFCKVNYLQSRAILALFTEKSSAD